MTHVAKNLTVAVAYTLCVLLMFAGLLVVRGMVGAL